MTNVEKLKKFVEKNTDEKGYLKKHNFPVEQVELILLKTSCGAGYVRKYECKAEVNRNILLLHEHDFNAGKHERKHIIYRFLIKE